MITASHKSLDRGWCIPNAHSVHFFLIVGLFATISLLVLSHVLDSLEFAIIDGFHNIQGALLDRVMIAITVRGDVTVIFPVGVVLIILRRTSRQGLVILNSLVVICILLVYLKPVYRRINGRPVEIPNVICDLRPKLMESYGSLDEEDQEALIAETTKLTKMVDSIYEIIE